MSAKLYKVGDRVRVKQIEIPKGSNCVTLGGILFLSEMCQFCGKEYVIKQASGDYFYKLEGVDDYILNDEMLEPVIDIDINNVLDFLNK